MNLTVTTDDSPPQLAYFSETLNSVTKEGALESIQYLAQKESENWFRIGMVLSSYHKNKGELEFKNLLEYSEQNFQINQRKAYYLISIYDNLVASNISPDQVSSIGWTKLKEIAHLLTESNVSYWIDICSTNTTKQILTLLKSNASTDTSKASSIDAALSGDTTGVPASKDGAVEAVKDDTTAIEAPPKLRASTTGLESASTGKPSSEDITPIKELDTSNFDSGVTTVDLGVTFDSTSHKNYEAPDSHHADATPAFSETSLETSSEVSEVTDLSSATLDLAPNQDTTNAPNTNKLVLDLKEYPLPLIVKTITAIFPNLIVKVTEKEVNFD